MANRLSAEAEAYDELVVLVELGALEVVQQLTATAGHGDQSAAAVEVLTVRAQVVSEVLDAG